MVAVSMGLYCFAGSEMVVPVLESSVRPERVGTVICAEAPVAMPAVMMDRIHLLLDDGLLFIDVWVEILYFTILF
jgi:hypothetical protein